MNQQAFLAAIGLAAYGACPDCGDTVIAQAGLSAADAQAAHTSTCLARMALAVAEQVTDPATALDILEYARLKIQDQDETAERRYKLRDAIGDRLQEHFPDALGAWEELCGSAYETEAEHDGLDALARDAGPA
jgi:hypothetical protein